MQTETSRETVKKPKLSLKVQCILGILTSAIAAFFGVSGFNEQNWPFSNSPILLGKARVFPQKF
jgi:hypothetical protein